MKVSSLAILFLTVSILIFSLFLCGRQINAKIEESIKNNYENEINALKIRLDKHSELINSIIDLNNKDHISGEEKPSDSENTSSEILSEFQYVKEDGGITIMRYLGKQTSVSIPNTIEQLPVLKIAENAFTDTKIKSVTLPSSCKEIDWFAFYGCYALNTVYVSKSVESIGYGAFEGCSKSLIIYCEKDSFAEKYAQSFGISTSYFK